MPHNPVSDVVQKLQADLRESRVRAERFRLETEDLRAKVGKPDPRLARLETEVRRLREELNGVRDQRDDLLLGVRAALEKLERARMDSGE
ncbi:MAG: hypothetical protein ABI401_05330 [Candidatus Dormibacter sp.]